MRGFSSSEANLAAPRGRIDEWVLSTAREYRRYKKRGKSEPYADFCQLSNESPEPILFLGGLDYQPLFENLTADLPAEKVVVHRSASMVHRPGFTYVEYDTPARTNWHYLCARDLMAGRVPVPPGRAP